LQYAHARACSILKKAGSSLRTTLADDADFDDGERPLARKLAGYSVAVDRAMSNLAPHEICTFLYELSQDFNRFYESSKVVGDSREKVRLQLVGQYAKVLRDGLAILGIEAPEKM
jgi:arginyl-tRNA synthetase